ncbi:MAG: hypothetical protein AAFQ37_02985, partial [Bacteroidota bacterium]
KDFIDTKSSASSAVLDDEQISSRLSEKQVVLYGRITTVVLMLLAAFWAPMIQHFSGIWIYLQQMFSIIVPPVVVIFLVGVFYKRGNGDGAFYTLLLGTASGVALFILGQYGYWPFHFTTNVGIMVGLCTLLFIGFSQLSPAPDQEQIASLVYRPGLLDPEDNTGSLLQDWRFQAVCLLVLMGVLLYFFW